MSRAETQGPMLAAGSVRTISECDVMKSVTPTRPGAACDGAIPVTQTAVITAARLSHRDAQTARVRVLIAHGNPIVRLGLHSVLDAQADILVVGQATRREALLSLAREAQPDVIILDAALRFEPENDYEAPVSAVQVVAELHRAGIRGIFVLAASHDEEDFFRFLVAGAAAYVSPSLTSADLQDLLRRVAEGLYLMSGDIRHSPPAQSALSAMRKQTASQYIAGPTTPQAMPRELPCAQTQTPATSAIITKRQIEVLQYVVWGKTNKEIAKILSISEQTVKNHLTETMKTFGTGDRTGAVVIALRLSLVTLHDASAERQAGTRDEAALAAPESLQPMANVRHCIQEPDHEAAEFSTADPLTDREMQVLQLVAEGKLYKEVAKLLGITKQTVQHHMSAAMNKLGAHDRRQATALAVKYQLVQPPAALVSPCLPAAEAALPARPQQRRHEAGQATGHAPLPDQPSVPRDGMVAMVAQHAQQFQGGTVCL